MNLEKLVTDCLAKHRCTSRTVSAKKQHPNQLTAKTRHNSIKKTIDKEYSTVDLIGSQVNRFQPLIHELPANLYKPSAKTECSREEIIDRLLNDKRDKENMWAQVKLKKDDEQFADKCTFRPSINENSKKIMKTQCTEGHNSIYGNDAFERLYNQGLNKIRVSESSTIIDRTIANKENFSFQPQTNYQKILNSQTTNAKPIYLRIDEIMQEKRDHLQDLIKQNAEKQLQQRPKISDNSLKLISNKQEFKKSLLERLSIYMREQKQRKNRYSDLKEEKVLKDCTFKPQINSSAITFDNFDKRQAEYLQKLNQKLTSRIREEDNKNFKPHINKISNILVAKDRTEENWQDKIARLAYDNEKKEGKIYEIEQEIYRECTFEPQINMISKCLGEQSRRKSYNHAKHTCENMVEKEQEYEFKPKINKISEYLVKLKRESEPTSRSTTKKNQVDLMKMEAEYKQMKECTFQPKINSRKTHRNKTHSSVQNIPGFDAYYEKVNKVNFQKNKQKKRQEELFNLQKRYQYRKFTEPKQFQLSKGGDHRMAVKMEVEKKFEEECTFKPHINQYR